MAIEHLKRGKPEADRAEETLSEIDRLLDVLPTADTARVSWQDYGEAAE